MDLATKATQELIRQTEELSAQSELLQGIKDGLHDVHEELRELRRIASIGGISVYVMKDTRG